MLIAATQVGNILVAAVAALAAVIAAGIAAYTASRRLQLQLTAEAQRHRDMLEHERTLADRAELRAVLDDAAAAMAEARETLLRATSWLHEIHPTDSEQSELGTLLTEIDDHHLILQRCSQRIALRLGRSEQGIHDLYARATAVVLLMHAHLRGYEPQKRDHIYNLFRQYNAHFSHDYGAFLDGATTIVGSTHLPGAAATFEEGMPFDEHLNAGD